jgi:hypothetical protein
LVIAFAGLTFLAFAGLTFLAFDGLTLSLLAAPSSLSLASPYRC